MVSRSPEYLTWLEEMLTEHARALQEHPEWVPADEYQAAVDEALAWKAEAHAEREFYDNDSYFFTGTGSTYFHGERG